MITPFERLIEIVVFALCVWLLATSFSLTPDARGHGTHEQLGMAPCGFLATTGHPCPSCGMTTSFSHMAHAQPAQSFRANPAGGLLFLVVLAAPFWILYSWGHSLPALRVFAGSRGGWWLLAGILIVGASWLYKDGVIVGS